MRFPNTISAQLDKLLSPQLQGLGFLPATFQAAASAVPFHHVDAREAALMKSLHADGYGVQNKIAKLAKRGTNTVATTTEQVFKRMLRAYEKLLKDAHPGVVAVAMLKGKMGLLCSE